LERYTAYPSTYTRPLRYSYSKYDYYPYTSVRYSSYLDYIDYKYYSPYISPYYYSPYYVPRYRGLYNYYYSPLSYRYIPLRSYWYPYRSYVDYYLSSPAWVPYYSRYYPSLLRRRFYDDEYIPYYRAYTTYGKYLREASPS
jgi:hypothetical protein